MASLSPLAGPSRRRRTSAHKYAVAAVLVEVSRRLSVTRKMVAVRVKRVGKVVVIERLVETPRGTRVIDGQVVLSDNREDRSGFDAQLQQALEKFYPSPS